MEGLLHKAKQKHEESEPQQQHCMSFKGDVMKGEPSCFLGPAPWGLHGELCQPPSGAEGQEEWCFTTIIPRGKLSQSQRGLRVGVPS